MRGFFDLLDDVEFPTTRQRVLMNRYSTRAGGPSKEEVARYLGREADYVIPYDRKIILAANTGKPFITSSISMRWNKAASAIRELVDDIEAFGVASVAKPATVSSRDSAGQVAPSGRLANNIGGELA